MSTQNITSNRTTSNRLSGSRILVAGVAAVVAAVLANLVVRAVLFAVMDLPREFMPFSPGAIAFFTTVGVGLGAVVYALIARRSKQPARTFTIVALVALVLSILPNFAMMANPAAAPFPGATAVAFGVLIVFHLVAGLVAILVLTRIAGR